MPCWSVCLLLPLASDWLRGLGAKTVVSCWLGKAGILQDHFLFFFLLGKLGERLSHWCHLSFLYQSDTIIYCDSLTAFSSFFRRQPPLGTAVVGARCGICSPFMRLRRSGHELWWVVFVAEGSRGGKGRVGNTVVFMGNPLVRLSRQGRHPLREGRPVVLRPVRQTPRV